MFANCPKCGHAPLPKDQASPAACPACGIILAKFGTAAPRPAHAARTEQDPDTEADEQRGFFARMFGALVEVPPKVWPAYWYARIATLAVFVLWTVWIFKSYDLADGNTGSNFLHLVLTPFHEVGHMVFMWAGNTVHYAAGTLGQYAMPIILAVALIYKRGDTFGAALFTWMLGFSLSDSATYMYDAYDPHIMLLTGYTGAESANHDFIQVFGDLNVLNKAREIGRFFMIFGRAVTIASLAWAAFLLWKQHGRLDDSPLTEESLD